MSVSKKCFHICFKYLGFFDYLKKRRKLYFNKDRPGSPLHFDVWSYKFPSGSDEEAVLNRR